MTTEDKHVTRRREYSKYIKAIKANNGVMDTDALTALNNAFDISEEDILKYSQEIANNSPIDVRMARFILLMEDLRDYRDTLQIKAGRSDLLRSCLADDLETNEGFLFLG